MEKEEELINGMPEFGDGPADVELINPVEELEVLDEDEDDEEETSE